MYKLKNFLKRITIFHSNRDKKNILIFSSPRSGSTWLLELIVNHSKGKSIGEPFDLRRPLVRKNLNVSNWEYLIKIKNIEEISDYLNKIANGELSFKNPPPFSKYHKFIVDHSVIKILHGGETMIEELGDKLNAKIVYLVRHPIPVSISRKELPRLKSFVESDDFKLTAFQKKISKEIFNNGSQMQKAILDWCYQNYLTLSNNKNNWLIISYEQMVLDPESVIKELNKREIITEELGKVYKSLQSPSKNTYQSSVERKKLLKNKESDPKELIKNWLSKVDENQINQVQEILDVFNIDLYKANSPFPKNMTNYDF